MGRQPRRRELPSGLAEHGLDPLYRLGADQRCRGVVRHLVGRLQGGGQVHQPLDLDPVPGTHVGDVVEVGGSADHLGSPVRVTEIERS